MKRKQPNQQQQESRCEKKKSPPTSTQREHIDYIRKTKFFIGGEPNPLTEDLHQSVKNLSAELYAKDVHFLMEIIQNAEDNTYSEGVKPSLEFIVTSHDITGTGATSTLLIFNNEQGFSDKNIESVCSVGRSTKKGQRQSGYIGEIGIGFKSVFLITTQPYIFSNGYQIKFNEEPCPHCNLGYIVPEWVEEKPILEEIRNIYGPAEPLPATIFILPLKSDKEKVVKLQLSNIHPEVLLFLSKIKRLSVRNDNEDSSVNTGNAISISSETDFVTRKNVDAESYTIHLSAQEECDNNERECSYYMWRQKFPVNQKNRVERRMEIDDLVITLAFPNGQRLNRGMSSPGIYAFLPTEMVTNFPFIIQADFVLASSREIILLDNRWNQGILDCVPSAFVNAFVSLVKTSRDAPASSLPRMFEFIPTASSSYPKLNTVRDLIKGKLLTENIMLSESYTEQKFFYKPSEVGRIITDFWNILVKAREKGVSLQNLSSHGIYALNSSFNKKCYSNILKFLEVRFMNNEWFAKCIQSSNLVLGLSEDVYLELLLFIAERWRSHFQHTNMKNIPLLKYLGQDGDLYLCSVNDVTKKICLSRESRHFSWLVDWNKEFRCVACFFMPKSTQETLFSFHSAEILKKWLFEYVKVGTVNVNTYATMVMNSLNSDRRLIVAFAHFLCQSLSMKYVSQEEVESLCKIMPLLDNYACVTTPTDGVLVPAKGSKWVGLIGSNPWKNYVELGEDYLHAGNFCSVHTSEKQLMKFLKTHIKASDIPDLCPPDDTFPAVSSPLTQENTILLLQWIRRLKRNENLVEGEFLRCIKEGSWLRTSVGYKPPSQSFLLTSTWGNVVKSGSEVVDIPLIDQEFYGKNINNYKDELKTLGVICEFREVCMFMGRKLTSLASSKPTRSIVFSILNFIRFLKGHSMDPDDFIKTVKEGQWLRTSHGERYPVGSILFDSEWKSVSKLSDLPFIDHKYYGERILDFKTELQLLGVLVGFDRNYQLVVDCFRMTASFSSITVEDIFLILDCIRHASSSDKIIGLLNDKKWLWTTLGQKSPHECFLYDSEWGCLLQIFDGYPLISENSYGNAIISYKNELKKLGVVVDFEDAAKIFASQFKQLASSCSFTKETALLFLQCYRKLKQKSDSFPIELQHCIRNEKWLKTRLGQRSPKESILFSSDWEHISPIGLLPFIGDTETTYGASIHEYKEELEAIGVVVEFYEGSAFVASGLNFPQSPTAITPSSVLSLLECICNLMKEKGDLLSGEFLERLNKPWLKTYIGYRPPNECLLFGSEWDSLLLYEDAPFIDEHFYGHDLSSYRKELCAVGVIVDIGNGCQLLARQLETHCHFDVIVRIYTYLKNFNWKPDNKAANWIWIPDGSDKGQWVSPEECVINDKDGLFGLQLKVLEKHYDKTLLDFFSKALDVKKNPSVDDFYRLWKTWENSRCQLTPAECYAFWECMVKHWGSDTKNLLGEMVKLPVNTDSDVILLFNKQDVFIPDDLLLMDLFEKASPHPTFVWYPQSSLASMSRSKFYDKYRSIGVQSISGSVQKSESSKPDGQFKKVNPREVLIKRELMNLVMAFLSDPSVDMDANRRQKTVKSLLNVEVFETEEPISVSYSLSLSSGESVNVKACQMVRWDRKCSKMFFQKVDRSSGNKTNIEFATHFSQVVAEGLLWENEDWIAPLSELIKLGWLLEFEEDAIRYLLKTKNLQVLTEDIEFLSSTFPTEYSTKHIDYGQIEDMSPAQTRQNVKKSMQPSNGPQGRILPTRGEKTHKG